jgi:hypothetical protein
LIGYAREIEAQRRSHRAATMLHREWSDIEAEPALSVASAGYPGAWDDEYEEYVEYDQPQQVAVAR